MKPLFGYLFLAVGISFGIASNSFAKISDGFFGRWFYSWMFAFPVALLAAIIIAPMIRSLIDKITIE